MLGMILPDHIIVENLADIARAGYPVARFDQCRLMLFTDDVHAELDTLVANEDGWAGDQLPDLVLALAAKRAVERIFRVAAAGLGHRHSVTGGAMSTGTMPIATMARAARPRCLRSRDWSAQTPQVESGAGERRGHHPSGVQ